MVNYKGGEIGLGGALQGKRARFVAANGNDLTRKVAFPGGVDQSLQVGAAARGEHQDLRNGGRICLHAVKSPGA